MPAAISKKRALTLIELLLVIGLLPIVGGIVSWNIKKFFEKSHFFADCRQIESILRMGRTHAILSECDWDLQVSFDQGVTKLIWHSPEDLDAKSFLPAPTLLKGVRIFSNHSEPLYKIKFFSSGWVDPFTSLRLVGNGHSKEIHLNQILALSIDSAPSIEEILEKR